MEKIYRESYHLKGTECDRFGRLKPGAMLGMLQEVAVNHCRGTEVEWNALAKKGLFFAITRTYIRISRMPMEGEDITLETWPGVTTRVAYPRNTVAFDAQGNEVFRCISLWVLMDVASRAMVTPGKSGVSLDGWNRGIELPVPASIGLKPLEGCRERTVTFSELDRNGHMNNTHCADWVQDLLPSAFHAEHPLSELTVCYLSEALEGDRVRLSHGFTPEGDLLVNSFVTDCHEGVEKDRRVFAVRARYL